MSCFDPNETVRLITGVTRVMHTPEIIEGTASSTGKTVEVEVDWDSTRTKTYRLDADTLLAGDSEIRSGSYFQLYTPDRFQSKQRGNHAPGPQAGTNSVSDADDLPDATHTPSA